MANLESEIEAAGARIIWVLQKTSSNQPGTVSECVNFMGSQSASTGLCVGDSQSTPTYPFQDSALSNGRGIDLLVDPLTMDILFVAGHGSTGGNDNLTGAEILTEVQDAVAELQAGTSPCQ